MKQSSARSITNQISKIDVETFNAKHPRYLMSTSKKLISLKKIKTVQTAESTSLTVNLWENIPTVYAIAQNKLR